MMCFQASESGTGRANYTSLALRANLAGRRRASFARPSRDRMDEAVAVVARGLGLLALDGCAVCLLLG